LCYNPENSGEDDLGGSARSAHATLQFRPVPQNSTLATLTRLQGNSSIILFQTLERLQSDASLVNPPALP
jgi:hypothetical protein